MRLMDESTFVNLGKRTIQAGGPGSGRRPGDVSHRRPGDNSDVRPSHIDKATTANGFAYSHTTGGRGFLEDSQRHYTHPDGHSLTVTERPHFGAVGYNAKNADGTKSSGPLLTKSNLDDFHTTLGAITDK